MSFDRQPVRRGELLELRPLRTEDFDALFHVASDPLICRALRDVVDQLDKLKYKRGDEELLCDDCFLRAVL